MSKRIGRADLIIGQDLTAYRTIEDMKSKWFWDFVGLYTSVFSFSNMFLNVDMWQVELWNLNRGSTAAFIDPVLGPLILPYNPVGPLDVYGNPYRIRAYSTNGYQVELDPQQYVIMYDNVTKLPNRNFVNQYAERIAQVDKSIDINVAAMRTPIILSTPDDKQINSLKSAFKKVQSGEPVMISIGTTLQDGIQALNTDAPIVFPQLQMEKLELINEFLTFAGIPNRGLPKQERLVTMEMAAINGNVDHERTVRLQPRQRFCDQFNQKFGAMIPDFEPLSVDYSNVTFNYGTLDGAVSTPEQPGVV